MRFSALLVLATFASNNVLAKPIPSEHFNEIERRWSEGESEVCFLCSL
jgi:hypothetical protein